LGDFNVERLSAALRKGGGVKAEEVEGVEIFQTVEPPLYGAFVGRTAFVVTRSKKETLALARDGPPKASKQREEMLAVLGSFTGKETVVMAHPVTRARGVWDFFSSLNFLKVLNRATFSLTSGEDVTLALVGRTEDGKARTLRAQLTALQALGNAYVGMLDIPDVCKEILEEINIDNTRDTVTVTLKITAKKLAALAKLVGLEKSP
jgi:hypothetical protein